MLFFTVCHINQLAQACVLGDSLKSQASDYQFIIGLIDPKTVIPTSQKTPYPIIDITEISVPNFEEFCSKYTTEEILRNSKPFFAEYIFNQNQTAKSLTFIDVNSLIFNKLDFIKEKLLTNNIIIVPQITQANIHPDEKQILNTGIYHAGFFALSKTDETFKFLKWWQKCVAQKGYINLCRGLNAEQLWFEHIPTLFDKVHIEKHDGLNVGYWNLSERKVQQIEGHWQSNQSALISYNFKDLPHWNSYTERLNKYNPHQVRKIKPSFGIPIKPRKANFVSKTLRKTVNIVDILIDVVS